MKLCQVITLIIIFIWLSKNPFQPVKFYAVHIVWPTGLGQIMSLFPIKAHKSINFYFDLSKLGKHLVIFLNQMNENLDECKNCINDSVPFYWLVIIVISRWYFFIQLSQAYQSWSKWTVSYEAHVMTHNLWAIDYG